MKKIWLQHYPPHSPKSLKPYPLIPLYKLLTNSAKKSPHTTAIQFYGEKISYQELDKLSSSFAHSLTHNLKLKPKIKIGILLPNLPQFIIAYFGCLKAGLIPVLLSTIADKDTTTYSISHTNLKHLIYFQNFHSIIEPHQFKTLIKVNSSTFLPTHLKIISSIKTNNSPGIPFHTLISSPPKFKPPKIDSKNDTTTILFTSGVRGKPKAVELTHYNLVANSLQTTAWGEADHEIVCCVLPFFHSFGLTVSMLAEIQCQSTLHLYPKIDCKRILKDSNKYRFTYFIAVPLILKLLASHSLFPKAFRYLKVIVSGAEPMSKDLIKKTSHLPIHQGYGLTEASPNVMCNPVRGKIKPHSIGIPMADTNIKIIDPKTNKPTPPNTPGELLIKGPQVMKGYYNNPKLTKRHLKNGWLHTGDIVKIDYDGYIHFEKRLGIKPTKPKLNI